MPMYPWYHIYLMSVSMQCFLGFGNQHGNVCLQLKHINTKHININGHTFCKNTFTGIYYVTIAENKGSFWYAVITLNETINVSLAHSLTSGISILGTNCRLICSGPFIDWILCSGWNHELNNKVIKISHVHAYMHWEM